jgi:sensor domain CHASE-containing protein
MLTGDGSHSTDQPVGKVLGQGKPTIISSKDIVENIATSKAKYTNTQQGLLDSGM